MAGKAKSKRNGQNIKSNMSKRLARAERKWKSENYINDLKKALEKRH